MSLKISYISKHCRFISRKLQWIGRVILLEVIDEKEAPNLEYFCLRGKWIIA